MKTQKLLTPLAFAIATTLSAGAYAGASATIDDSQESRDSTVRNEGTQNNGSVNGSLGGASGNVGVNSAAGNNNQQGNAGAISTADALFVFGLPVNASADATITVSQRSRDNGVTNFSTPNNASLNDSAANSSGNIGVNVTAGDFNQQKNGMAIASSEEATTAGASVSVTQNSQGQVTTNSATLEYSDQAVSLTLNGGGTYEGQSDQIGNVYPDIWTDAPHPGGSANGHFDLDDEAQGHQDLNGDGGALAFNEAGSLDLEGTVTGFIPVVSGFKQTAINNSAMNNSLGGASGNVHANMSAGGGNQQNNSMSIAAGCNACVSQPGNGGGSPGGESAL